MMCYDKSVCERLKAALKRSGMSVRGLARASGVNLNTTRSLLQRPPRHACGDAHTLRDICKVPNVTVGWVLTGKGKEVWDHELTKWL